MLLALFLSFIVYGVGFVLRTENAIKLIQSSPSKYIHIDILQETVQSLWRDYQILGLVADNSPIPIEPLTSYGKILKNTRLLLYQSDRIQEMIQQMIGWKNISQKQSIFPLLDTLWVILDNSVANVTTLVDSASKLTPLEH